MCVTLCVTLVNEKKRAKNIKNYSFLTLFFFFFPRLSSFLFFSLFFRRMEIQKSVFLHTHTKSLLFNTKNVFVSLCLTHISFTTSSFCCRCCCWTQQKRGNDDNKHANFLIWCLCLYKSKWSPLKRSVQHSESGNTLSHLKVFSKIGTKASALPLRFSSLSFSWLLKVKLRRGERPLKTSGFD